MVAELSKLRDQIDDVDQQMVELLARRLALVEEVGHVKSQHGLPIYAPPDREAAMLLHAVRRRKAKGFRLILLKIFYAAPCGSLIPVKMTRVLNA